ncbi:MAG: hypothetical protein U1F83_00745 [Verrucomicrobiota bacterium]
MTATLLAIRQAYVALHPVGNGIDWKMGVFDTILRCETLESGNKPETQAALWVHLEANHADGVARYLTGSPTRCVSGGIVDTVGPTINGRANPPKAESFKAYTGSWRSPALPSNWGWLAGCLSSGILCGFDASAGGNRTRDNCVMAF